MYKYVNLRKDEYPRQNNKKKFCDASNKYNVYYNKYIMTVDHSKECFELLVL